MELTRTDAVYSRITMVLFFCRNKSSRNDQKINGVIFGIYKKYWKKNPRQGAHTLSTRVGTRLPPWAPPCLVGPLTPHRPQLQLHIFVFGEKKIREKDSSCFMIRICRQALNSLGRADLESFRGSGEGNPSPSSSSTVLHHQFHDAHRLRE